MNVFGKALSVSTLALSFNSLSNQWSVSARLNNQLPIAPPKRLNGQVINTPRSSQIRRRQLDTEMGANQNQRRVRLNEVSEAANSSRTQYPFVIALFSCFGVMGSLFACVAIRTCQNDRRTRNQPRYYRSSLQTRRTDTQNLSAAPSPRPAPRFKKWKDLPEAPKPNEVNPEAKCPISLNKYEEIEYPVWIQTNENTPPYLFSYPDLKKWITTLVTQYPKRTLVSPGNQPFNPETDIYRLTPYHELNNNDNKLEESPITTDTPAPTNSEVNADTVDTTNT